MDTLYRMDIDSKPPKKPFKPFITPPHGSEEILIREEVEEEDGLVNLDNLIEEIDSLVIEEDLDLEDPL